MGFPNKRRTINPTFSDHPKSMPRHLQYVALDIFETILISSRADRYIIARQSCVLCDDFTVVGEGLSSKANSHAQAHTEILRRKVAQQIASG